VLGQVIQHAIATWGYYAVFSLCALEGFGFFFVPGETALIVASIAAAGPGTHPAQQLSIVWVLVVAFCGAVLGDNFSFWVGHKFGFGLLYRYGPYVKLNFKRLKFIQYLYLRYGRPIVFVGRFIMLLRAWESFLAGANTMPWRKFAPVNAAAILIWVLVWGLGAYALGEASETVLEAVGIAIFVVFCVLFVLGWIYFRRHEDELEAASERALPGHLRPRPEGSRGAKAAKESPAPGKAP